MKKYVPHCHNCRVKDTTIQATHIVTVIHQPIRPDNEYALCDKHTEKFKRFLVKDGYTFKVKELESRHEKVVFN